MYPYIYIVLPSYGVLAFLGFFFALIFLFFRKDRYNIEFNSFLKISLLIAIGIVIGSKLLYAATMIPWLVQNFSWINLLLLVPQSGFVYYGGLFGMLGALWLASRKDRDKRDRLFRMFLPSIPLFHAFGRIGCFMAGCCYGRELSSPLVIAGFEFARIPVQLIEALFEFLMFILFIILEKAGSKLYSLGNYLMLYAVFRFVIEFFRGDTVRGIWFGGLSTAQYISIIIVAVVIFTKVRRLKAK